jgi:uncharacterized membrane protein YphA (DoxX/SURF4 family)
MTKTFELGRAIFAAAIAGLGVQCILRSNAVPALEPVLTASALPVVGWVTGIVLISAAIAMLLRATARYGAAVIAAMLLLWVAFLHIPALAATSTKGNAWAVAFETFALSGAAMVLFGLTMRQSGYNGASVPLANRATTIGRWMYGASMPAFGVLQFLYIPYVASVQPHWIPAHVFFAYATGVAQVASGLSLLTGVLSRVAAYATAAMFGSWVLILHAPRVLRDSQKPSEWTSMLIALGMCGGALLIASALSNISPAAARAGDTTFAPPVTNTTCASLRRFARISMRKCPRRGTS